MEIDSQLLNAYSLVYKQGTMPDGLIVLEEGQILAMIENDNGFEIIFQLMGPAVFGEEALSGINARQYSVISLSDIKFKKLPKNLFDESMESAPSWVTELINELGGKFDNTISMMKANKVSNQVLVDEYASTSELKTKIQNILSGML